jgi:hypothetical protein
MKVALTGATRYVTSGRERPTVPELEEGT